MSSFLDARGHPRVSRPSQLDQEFDDPLLASPYEFKSLSNKAAPGTGMPQNDEEDEEGESNVLKTAQRFMAPTTLMQ
jgi:hypothetical protein